MCLHLYIYLICLLFKIWGKKIEKMCNGQNSYKSLSIILKGFIFFSFARNLYILTCTYVCYSGQGKTLKKKCNGHNNHSPLFLKVFFNVYKSEETCLFSKLKKYKKKNKCCLKLVGMQCRILKITQ